MLVRHTDCWDPNRVREVINPEAESVPDAIFRAVHSDWILKVATPVGTSYQELHHRGTRAYKELTPQDFLARFLQDGLQHVQAAVLGRSGSGKSHFIHWLRLNIPETTERMVLVVPKAGTSLRSIIELIVSRLPEPDQKPFREALSRVGDSTMTRDGQKGRLLNELAQSIAEMKPQEATDELEAELIQNLPYIFQDPYMRQEHFLREGTVISEIVNHVFAAPDTYRPTEDRRQFSEDDLPTGGKDFTNASTLAQNALQVIYLEGGFKKSIDLINRSLDLAISRTLSFSGDRLIGLMGTLRRHLRDQGRELVLLIEDFARLQGIDRALLQALLEQGDDELCRLRWAIAVTTGFFETIAETVYTRMSFFVDMDTSASGGGTGKKMDPTRLANFSSRYLNAVRVGRADLEEWGRTSQSNEPPNPCLSCTEQAECHATFGAKDSYGLYPFTEKALWNMAERADGEIARAFNPRILQNQVLAPVLDNYAATIPAAQYPPTPLLEQLGGVKHLSVLDQTNLRRLLPQDADRAAAFLELYDGSGSLNNLKEELHRAFSLPLIPGGAQAEGEDDTGGDAEPEGQESQPADPRIVELQAWARGGNIGQSLAQTLRERIFEAVVEAVDWDNLRLSRSAYAAAAQARPFRNNSIILLRQTTRPTPGLVSLMIPALDASQAEVDKAALAFQGLLKAGPSFDWGFEGGAQMLATFLDCVGDWTKEVERQLKELSKPSSTWDPVAGAMELLVIGAALAGHVRAGTTTAEIVDGAFRDWPQECASETASMRQIYSRLSSKRITLVDYVRAHISGSKGGRPGAFIDPKFPQRVIRKLRDAKWALTQTAPTDARGDQGEVVRIYASVARDLVSAAEQERATRLAWLEEMEQSFGKAAKKRDIFDRITSARDAVVQIALGGSSSNNLKNALDAFNTVQFDDALNAAAAIRDEADPLANIPLYGRGRSNAVAAGRELSRRLHSFIQDTGSNLDVQERQNTQTHAELESSLKKIAASLESITAELAHLEQSDAA